MALWKVSGNRAKEVKETSFVDESISEREIEDWIEANPEILGEPLLLIGRQVAVADLGDTIDLLALDQDGNTVIVELKRAELRAPVDVQAIRYASYVSRWSNEQLEEIARGQYQDDDDDDEFSLETKFIEFSDAAGAGEEVELNGDQRVIIVGQQIRDRLGSVALWLRDRDVDIKLIEIHPFKDGDELYLEPLMIIPPPTTEQWEVGTTVRKTGKPWLNDGRGWWRQRAGATQFERLEQFISMLTDAALSSRVSYDQRHYIAVYRGKRTWVRIQPTPARIRVDVRCRESDFDVPALADKLGLREFEDDADLSEKLSFPSSVGTYQRRAYFCLRLRIKDDYDLATPGLVDFFRQAAAVWGDPE